MGISTVLILLLKNIEYYFFIFVIGKVRYEKAVSKYLQRKNQTSAPAPTPAISAERVAECEKIKEQGNGFFRRGDFQSAINAYTEAINLYEENPNKYIYLCNRATAAFYLNDLEMAETGILSCLISHFLDCKQSISLNPKHIKAYTRLAAVYQKLNRLQDAVRTCSEGLQHEPGNADLTGLLNRLNAQQGNNPANASGAAPNFSDLMGSLASDPSIREAAQGIANGNMSGLGDLMNNPAIAQM